MRNIENGVFGASHHIAFLDLLSGKIEATQNCNNKRTNILESRVQGLNQ